MLRVTADTKVILTFGKLSSFAVVEVTSAPDYSASACTYQGSMSMGQAIGAANVPLRVLLRFLVWLFASQVLLATTVQGTGIINGSTGNYTLSSVIS